MKKKNFQLLLRPYAQSAILVGKDSTFGPFNDDKDKNSMVSLLERLRPTHTENPWLTRTSTTRRYQVGVCQAWFISARWFVMANGNLALYNKSERVPVGSFVVSPFATGFHNGELAASSTWYYFASLITLQSFGYTRRMLVESFVF